MGSNSRYDRVRPVTSREVDEARALHMLGEVVPDRPMLVLNRSTILQMAEVMHATAIELSNGRPVALAVRKAVIRMANALRESLDPRAGAEQSASDAAGSAAPRSGRPGSQ